MDNKPFISGLIGGCYGVIISHPLDTIRINLQNSNNKLNNIITNIYKNEGVKGFYKGIYPPLIGVGIEKLLVFGFYDNIKRLNISENKIINNSISGLGAGLICTLVVTPIEKIKILQQEKIKWNNIKLKYLYNGWTATLFREVPGYAIYFTTYNILNDYNKNNNLLLNGLNGGLSGLTSWLFIYPSDPIKTKMQIKNINFINSFNEIYKKEGIKGFYKGFSMGLFRSFVLHSSVFMSYEYINKII